MARPTPRAPLLLATLAGALGAGPARAQVNVETLRSDIAARPRSLSIQASYTGHAGNGNGSVASAGSFGVLAHGRHLWFAKGQGDYAQFGGAATIAKLFGHARYNYRILPFLFGEVFSQIEMNQFQRLALRQLNGIGPRFALVRWEEFEIFYGAAYMVDYVKVSPDPAVLPLGPPQSSVRHRFSNYLSMSWKLSERVRLSNVLYVQPRFDDFTDVRLLDEAAFTVDLDKRFAGRVTCQLRHNSRPPSGLLRTDVDTVTSLIATF